MLRHRGPSDAAATLSWDSDLAPSASDSAAPHRELSRLLRSKRGSDGAGELARAVGLGGAAAQEVLAARVQRHVCVHVVLAGVPTTARPATRRTRYPGRE